MAKIMTLKVQIPADDYARVEPVKAKLQALIRAQGKMNADSADGQGTILASLVFYDAADVKFWVTQGERKPKGKAL